MKDDIVGGRGRESDCQDKKTKYLETGRGSRAKKQKKNEVKEEIKKKRSERHRSDLLCRKCISMRLQVKRLFDVTVFVSIMLYYLWT